MFQATTNQQVHRVEATRDGILVDGVAFAWDILQLRDGHFHILHAHKGYRVEVLRKDPVTKTVELKVNERVFQVAVKDKFDLLLDQMGLGNSNAARMNSLRAPMPGLVVDLKVTAGAVVKAGDPLIILEAMKMENIIKAGGDATVKEVKVRVGQGVEKNQVLIEF